MTKTKFYTYCFRAAMTSPESCRFLDFRINLWLVVVLWYFVWKLHEIYRIYVWKINIKKLRKFTSSCPEVFLKIWKSSLNKDLSRSHFFNKVADLKPVTVLKKRLQHMYFSMNNWKILKTPILKNMCELLLKISNISFIHRFDSAKECPKPFHKIQSYVDVSFLKLISSNLKLC